MSFDIYVLVPAGSWPTARQFDDALIVAGYPVRLDERSAAAWDQPLAPVPADSIRVVVHDAEQARLLGKPIGGQVELPSHIALPVLLDGVALDPDFGMQQLTDVDSLNADLKNLDDGPVASAGDYLVWFSHHSDQRHYNAGMYVLAILILRFDAHGFEWQGMAHGREDFARELLDSLYENPVENPFV